MAGLFELLAGQFGVINFVKSALSVETLAEDIVAQAVSKFTGVSEEKVNQIIEFFQVQQPAAQSYLENLGRTELPDVRQLLPPVTNQLSNFSYVVQVNGLLPSTSRTVPQFVTVISDSLLTKRAAAQIAFSRVQANTSASYDISPVNADVLSISYKGTGTSQQVFGPNITEGFGHGLF